MDFSIIIPSYNGRHLLADCLKSIDTLDYPRDRFEVIVVDNGSKDDTGGEVKRHKSIKIIRLSRNQGFAAASNRGAAAANGDYLFFLNNDTVVDAHVLNGFIKVLDPASGVDVAAAKIIDATTGMVEFAGGILNICHIGKCRGAGLPPEGFTESSRTIFFSGGACAIKRELFLSVGGFDDDFFAYYEDVDLSMRLNLLGHRIIFAPEAVVYHAGGSTSKKLGVERLRIFHIRNPLLSIIKNTENRYLAQFLLHALLISLYRTSGYLFEGNIKNVVELVTGKRKVNPLLLSDLTAYREVVSSIHKTIRKRKLVQAGRAVPDLEIFPLYGEPFWDVEAGLKFTKYSHAVRMILRIEKLFAKK